MWGGNLTTGKTLSCGCFAKEKKIKLFRKYDYTFIKQTIENFGYTLLSDSLNFSSKKLDVICKNGHLYHPRFSTILNGNGCSICAKKARLTYEFVKGEIEKRGGILLSKEYKNCKQRLNVVCSEGHEWETCFDTIKQGSWCGICGGSKSNIEECQKLADEHNGKCLSIEYKNAMEKLEWECEFGHRWFANRNDIRNGSWCTECSENKTQKKLTNIIRDLFPDYIIYSNFKNFDWLKTDNFGHKMELDIFVPSIKLAIEYDGEQHFYPVCFGGISKERAEKNLEKVKLRDIIKNKKISENSNDVKYFIRFSYKEKKELDKEYVKAKLEDNFKRKINENK